MLFVASYGTRVYGQQNGTTGKAKLILHCIARPDVRILLVSIF